jgi:hypothetical protein
MAGPIQMLFPFDSENDLVRRFADHLSRRTVALWTQDGSAAQRVAQSMIRCRFIFDPGRV